MKLTTLLVLACCSSRPELAVPPDAGPDCADCWRDCGKAESRKAASMCAWECGLICEGEGR